MRAVHSCNSWLWSMSTIKRGFVAPYNYALVWKKVNFNLGVRVILLTQGGWSGGAMALGNPKQPTNQLLTQVALLTNSSLRVGFPGSTPICIKTEHVFVLSYLCDLRISSQYKHSYRYVSLHSSTLILPRVSKPFYKLFKLVRKQCLPESDSYADSFVMGTKVCLRAY